MNKSLKKVLVVSLMLITMISITACGKKESNTESGNNKGNQGSIEKVNDSKELNTDKTFESYKVSDISLRKENGVNVLMATIENVSSSATVEGVYNIIFTDKSGTEKSKVSVFIKALQPGETLDVKASINLDVIDSYDFKLVKM